VTDRYSTWTSPWTAMRLDFSSIAIRSAENEIVPFGSKIATGRARSRPISLGSAAVRSASGFLTDPPGVGEGSSGSVG